MRLFLIALLIAISYAQTVTIPNFNIYPGRNSNSMTYTGSAEFQWAEKQLEISYTIDNPDQCARGALDGVANSCGIHIHEGVSCENADDVGGHYFSQDDFTEDPWKNITYSGESGSVGLNYGFTYDESVGHALVIHNINGTRISCDLIPGTTPLIIASDDEGGLLKKYSVVFYIVAAVITILLFSVVFYIVYWKMHTTHNHQNVTIRRISTDRSTGSARSSTSTEGYYPGEDIMTPDIAEGPHKQSVVTYVNRATRTAI